MSTSPQAPPRADGYTRDMGGTIRSYVTTGAALVAGAFAIYQLVTQHQANEAAAGPPGARLSASITAAAAGARSGDDKRMILARLALSNGGSTPVELRLGAPPERPDDPTVYVARIFSVDEQGDMAFGPRRPLHVSTSAAPGDLQSVKLGPGDRKELRAVQVVSEPGLYVVRFFDPAFPSLSAETMVEIPAMVSAAPPPAPDVFAAPANKASTSAPPGAFVIPPVTKTPPTPPTALTATIGTAAIAAVPTAPIAPTAPPIEPTVHHHHHHHHRSSPHHHRHRSGAI